MRKTVFFGALLSAVILSVIMVGLARAQCTVPQADGTSNCAVGVNRVQVCNIDDVVDNGVNDVTDQHWRILAPPDGIGECFQNADFPGTGVTNEVNDPFSVRTWGVGYEQNLCSNRCNDADDHGAGDNDGLGVNKWVISENLGVNCNPTNLPAGQYCTKELDIDQACLKAGVDQVKTVGRIFQSFSSCGGAGLIEANQIIQIQDTIPPYIGAPADITLECDNNIDVNPLTLGGGVIGYPTALDRCDPNPAITSIRTTNIGSSCSKVHTLKYTAKDCATKESSAFQIVTIKDTLPPFIYSVTGGPPASLADLTTTCTVPTAPTVKAKDACQQALDATLAPTETVVQGRCAFDKVYTRVYTANDGCGNIESVTQTITVVDDEPPKFTTIKDDFQELTCEELITVPFKSPALPTAKTAGECAAQGADNCGAATTCTADITVQPTADLGTYHFFRRYTLSDTCANTAEVNQRYLVHYISDLALATTTPTPATTVSGTFNVAVTVTNNGPCNIAQPKFTVSFDPYPFVFTAGTTLACDAANKQGEISCASAAVLNNGANVASTLSFAVPPAIGLGKYEFSINASSDEVRDPKQTNNKQRIVVTVA